MTLFVFLSVLAAAAMHATWNAMVKTGDHRLSVMLILTLVQGAIGLGVALLRPFPEWEYWGWLLASGVFHSGYKLFLTFAYNRGDLSRVYPIARGAAPFMVLGFSALFLQEWLGLFELCGIMVLGSGIILMARGVFYNAEDSKLVPLALGSAFCTAGYSLVDGLGARAMGDAVTYVAWLFVLDALFFSPIVYLKEGAKPFIATSRNWLLGGGGALASYGAYAIAVWAMTQAPIALVTALRESSVLFAMLLGWIVFKEKMDTAKILAGLLIVFGLVLTRITL